MNANKSNTGYTLSEKRKFKPHQNSIYYPLKWQSFRNSTVLTVDKDVKKLELIH